MNHTILLVEDTPDDVFFLQNALQKAGIHVPMQVVADGQEALRYLEGEGMYADRAKYPMPSLVLLDLQLPYVPGLKVLQEIRRQNHLRKIIVVVLTSSSAASDIEQAYELGANSYLVKPSSNEERRELVQLLQRYWLSLNRGPA